MKYIGGFYSDYGLAPLYKAEFKKDGWVTNLCYLNPVTGKLYSPNMANIVTFGRDISGAKRDSNYWAQYVSSAHDSFVLMR